MVAGISWHSFRMQVDRPFADSSAQKKASGALKEMIVEYETVNNCKIKKLVVKRVQNDNAKNSSRRNSRCS